MSFTEDDDAEPFGFSFHGSDSELDEFDLELGEEAEGRVRLDHGLDDEDLVDDVVGGIESEVEDDDVDDDEDDDEDEEADEDELLLDPLGGLDFEEDEE